MSRLMVWLRRPGARHVLVGCGIGIGLMLAIGTTTLIVMARQDDITHAKRDLRNLSYVLAEETDRGFAAAELVQTDLINAMVSRGIDTADSFDTVMASEEVNRDLRRRVAGLQHVNSVALVSARGKVINISRSWPVPAIDAADRDYFRRLSADPTRMSDIGVPVVGRTNGVRTILFARAYRSAHGQLIGIVITAMEITSFEDLFSHLLISPGSSVGLWRRDGVLMARFPYQDASIGTAYGVVPEFRQTMAARDHDVVLHASVVDGRQRLVVPVSVPHYPLMVTVTETMSAILADWQAVALWMASGTVLSELVLAAIVLLGVRQLRDQERLNAAYAVALEAEAARALAESELERARERERRDLAAQVESRRFNTALGNMVQGLLMFDGEQRLLVANARFTELWGMPPDAVRPGMSFPAFLQALADYGSITRDDLDWVIGRRAAMIDRHERGGIVWELSDGRVMSVTHQPMEDGWLATYEDISERRRADERMSHMARHDALTELPNRILFREELEAALGFARRGRLVALLCLDLDQFKTVNDTLGHSIGDALLQVVAQRLAGQVRETDRLARLGGDEFAIIQTVLDKPADAVGLAIRLIEILEAPFNIAGHHIVISTSIGIAFAPQDGVDSDVLLKNADLALYRAKVDGRRTYRVFHSAMDVELQARRQTELELRAALEAQQFELFYQPLIGVHTRAAGGFEALLRWRHPEKGLVPPGTFIALAEEIGLIVPIGAWVLREACATASLWPDALRVSVNLSPVQFKSRGLVAAVAAALRDSGLAAHRLELEITETVMMEDTEATLATLHELRALGVQIAMDDFGTGYSSLGYLRRFPFDRIKIDQSFVRELGKQRDCGAIIRAIVALSRELGIATTAEGVETTEQLRTLVLAGCSDLQGYLFSPPVPEHEVPDLLRRLVDVAELLPSVALVA